MDTQYRICTKCNQEKTLDEFDKKAFRPLGRSTICQSCRRDYYRDRYKNQRGNDFTRSKISKDEKQSRLNMLAETGTKQCTRCDNWKPIQDFNKDSDTYDGLTSWCKTCLYSSHQEWVSDNRSHVREQHRKFRQNYTPEKKEEIKAQQDAYLKHLKEQGLLRERQSKYRKAYNAKPKAKLLRKIYNHLRRIRTSTDDSYTVEEWIALCEHFDFHCINPACWKQLTLSELTVDHVVPLSKDGSNGIENIQPLCKSCNSKKRDKTIDYRPDAELCL
jgi:5-methylcytosine-specific restriction endonuclease McrA